MHKIFNNLSIVSNKSEPESFHYEVVGEVYNFMEDKKNMYYRQEATKELYHKLGSNVSFNEKYKDLDLAQNKTSTILPLYYSRIDEVDKVYDIYQQQTSSTKDYNHLSGTEIVKDSDHNEYRLLTHVKASDIKKNGRLRGNMWYREDV